MKRFIKSLILFLPIACLAYITLICIWGELMPGIFKKNLKNEEKQSAELKNRNRKSRIE